MEKEEINNKENTKDKTEDSSEDQKETQKNSEETSQPDEQSSPQEELDNLKDKLARTFAEMENQRRRYEKEKEDAFEYWGFAFAKEALKNTEALKKVSEHFEIINKDMLSILKKNNIEPIKSINEKLDPNLHQAMMEIEDETKEPGTIVQEIQKGFMMKDRLLRPSLVGVSKKKIDKELEKDKKTQENQPENEEN